MKISKTTLNQIDAELFSILSHYVDLKKSGGSYKGLSPFQAEKTPSFIFTPSKNIWKDFSSGKGGKSAIKFIMEIEGVGFSTAVRKACDILGLEIEYEQEDEELFYQNALESLKDFFKSHVNKILNYLHSRGINDESIKKWELGYAPSFKEMVDFFNKSSYKKELLNMKYFYKKDDNTYGSKFYNRAMFPIHNHYGELVGFSGRDLSGKSKAKYVNSNDFDFFKKNKILYGFDKINKDPKKIIIVEGQIDVILAHQYGFNIAVATQGTAFNQGHFNLLKDYDVMISFDGDKAGKKAAAMTTEILLKNGKEPKVCSLPEGKDVADILTTQGKAEYFKLLKHYTNGIDYMVDYLVNYDPESNPIDRVNEIKGKIDIFPTKIAEKILIKLMSITEDFELKVKKASKFTDELILVKFILENDLKKEFLEPFKECFHIHNFSYNFVKNSPNISEEDFYSLWKEFEISCYKRKINKIKRMDIPYKEKKEKIEELERSINATATFY